MRNLHLVCMKGDSLLSLMGCQLTEYRKIVYNAFYYLYACYHISILKTCTQNKFIHTSSSAKMITTEIISCVKMYSPPRHGDALQRQRQEHLCDFETNLVYVVNSRKLSHFLDRETLSQKICIPM